MSITLSRASEGAPDLAASSHTGRTVDWVRVTGWVGTVLCAAAVWGGLAMLVI